MVQPTRPFVDVKLGGKVTKALYDSGADISCISDEEFRKIPIDLRPNKQGGSNPLRYIGAGGQPLDVRGTFVLPIQVLGRQVQHPFRVIRGLHEKVILGADFINEQLLGYDPCRREVHWTGNREDNSDLRVNTAITIPEFSSRAVQLRTGLGKRQHVVAEIFREDCPHLAGGPGLVQTDEEGKCLVELLNTGSEPIFLERNQAIGQSEALQQGRLQAIDERLVEAIVSKEATRGRGSPTSTKNCGEKILEAAKLLLSVDVKRRYKELILKHHNVFSLEKGEHGFCSATKTMYQGFSLTEDGIIPGTNKLKAVKAAQPPSSVKQVRQFLGLCNFFRGHIQPFAQLTGPLASLTTKDSGCKYAKLPETALRAFRQLQSLLCSATVLSYPRKGRRYALITDVSLGDEKTPGRLGGILTQVDKKLFHINSYMNRKLQKYEKNYSSFLLEMQAAIFGMETFDVYLRGRNFFLFTDHKPLEELGRVQSMALNRLQQMMTFFDLEMMYKKGSKMPADFLSRNAVDAI